MMKVYTVNKKNTFKIEGRGTVYCTLALGGEILEEIIIINEKKHIIKGMERFVTYLERPVYAGEKVGLLTKEIL